MTCDPNSITRPYQVYDLIRKTNNFATTDPIEKGGWMTPIGDDCPFTLDKDYVIKRILPKDSMKHYRMWDILEKVFCECGCDLKVRIIVNDNPFPWLRAEDMPIIPTFVSDWTDFKIELTCDNAKIQYCMIHEKLINILIYKTQFISMDRYGGNIMIYEKCMSWHDGCFYQGTQKQLLRKIGSDVLPDDILSLILSYVSIFGWKVDLTKVKPKKNSV